MNKLLIMDTTHPINTRTERFKATLEKKYKVYVCSWSRNLNVNTSGLNDYFVFKTSIGYGNQIKKLLYLPLFFYFCLKVSFEVKPKIIFASHWDSLLCAILIKLLFIGKIKIIYDCLDMPTTSNSLLQKILLKTEKICIRFTNLTVFASRYFKELYPQKINNLIFENYPSKFILENQNLMPVWFKDKKLEDYKSKKNIAWIGVVRYFEILENILLSIQNTDYIFYVFGDGPDLDKLKDKVKELNMEEQVSFFGRYTSYDLEFIYGLSDLIWAAYPTNDFNAVYAISNKYFECSYFKKTPIISKCTKMAETLENNNNVILVNEYSPEEINKSILSFYKSTSFVKYEPDLTWEDNENKFLKSIEEMICI